MVTTIKTIDVCVLQDKTRIKAGKVVDVSDLDAGLLVAAGKAKFTDEVSDGECSGASADEHYIDAD